MFLINTYLLFIVINYQCSWAQPVWQCNVGNMVLHHLLSADNICVFGHSISRLVQVLNIHCDYADEHENISNCNSIVVAVFPLKRYKQPRKPHVSLNYLHVSLLNKSSILVYSFMPC